ASRVVALLLRVVGGADVVLRRGGAEAEQRQRVAGAGQPGEGAHLLHLVLLAAPLLLVAAQQAIAGEHARSERRRELRQPEDEQAEEEARGGLLVGGGHLRQH